MTTSQQYWILKKAGHAVSGPIQHKQIVTLIRKKGWRPEWTVSEDGRRFFAFDEFFKGLIADIERENQQSSTLPSQVEPADAELLRKRARFAESSPEESPQESASGEVPTFTPISTPPPPPPPFLVESSTTSSTAASSTATPIPTPSVSPGGLAAAAPKLAPSEPQTAWPTRVAEGERTPPPRRNLVTFAVRSIPTVANILLIVVWVLCALFALYACWSSLQFFLEYRSQEDMIPVILTSLMLAGGGLSISLFVAALAFLFVGLIGVLFEIERNTRS